MLEYNVLGLRSWDLALNPFAVRSYLFRFGDWWIYKLGPVLATALSTCFLLGVSPVHLWLNYLYLFLLLAVGSAFAALVNDWADQDDDLLVGKENHVSTLSLSTVRFLFVVCLLSGLLISCSLLSRPLLAAIYILNWFVFALYSIPPLRLKQRGFLGVLAIALGESVLPHVFTITFIANAEYATVSPLWIGAVAIWSLAIGLRSIISHQMLDRDNDILAGVPTFVANNSPNVIRNIGISLLFPVEIASFLVVLLLIDSDVVFVFLVLYMLMEFIRRRVWGVVSVVISPSAEHRLLMFEFYDSWFAMALIGALIIREPACALVLPFYLILFPQRFYWLSIELFDLLRRGLRRITI